MHCNFEVPQCSNAIIGVLLPFKGLLKTEGMLWIFHDKLVPRKESFLWYNNVCNLKISANCNNIG